MLQLTMTSYTVVCFQLCGNKLGPSYGCGDLAPTYVWLYTVVEFLKNSQLDMCCHAMHRLTDTVTQAISVQLLCSRRTPQRSSSWTSVKDIFLRWHEWPWIEALLLQCRGRWVGKRTLETLTELWFSHQHFPACFQHSTEKNEIKHHSSVLGLSFPWSSLRLSKLTLWCG